MRLIPIILFALALMGLTLPALAADGTPDQGSGGSCFSFQESLASVIKAAPAVRGVVLDPAAMAAVLKALGDEAQPDIDHIYVLSEPGHQNIMLVMTHGDCIRGTVKTSFAELEAVIGAGA